MPRPFARAAARVAPLVAAAFGLCAPAAAQVVWVVDDGGGPGVDFTEIQAAVDAASSGDAILVRGGAYGPVTISGKRLAVVVDAGQTATVRAPLRLLGLGASLPAVVRGLDSPASDPNATAHPGLELSLCAAPVWVEDCHFASTSSSAVAGAAFDGATLEGASAFTSVRSTYTARVANLSGNGLRATGSGVSFWGGGAAAKGGFQQTPFEPNTAFAGLRQVGGTLFVSGAALAGGDGADGFNGPGGCTPAQSGGPGLRVTDVVAYTVFGPVKTSPPPVATTQSPLLQPGSPGSDVGGCSAGPTVPFHLEAGTATALDGLSRRLVAPATAREGQSLVLQSTGAVGELVVALVSPEAIAPLTLPPLVGPLHVPATKLLVQGAVPASGTLTKSYTVPELGPGVDGGLVFLQSVFVTASGLPQISFGAPSATLLLDSGF